MQLTHTISLLEVIWTPFCFVGFVISARLLWRSGTDLVVLRVKRINSIREYAAMTTVYLFSALTIVQFLFMLIGGILMMRPETNEHPTGGVFIVGSLFIMTSMIFDVLLLLVERRRQVIIRKIAEIENMEPIK